MAKYSKAVENARKRTQARLDAIRAGKVKPKTDAEIQAEKSGRTTTKKKKSKAKVTPKVEAPKVASPAEEIKEAEKANPTKPKPTPKPKAKKITAPAPTPRRSGPGSASVKGDDFRATAPSLSERARARVHRLGATAHRLEMSKPATPRPPKPPTRSQVVTTGAKQAAGNVAKRTGTRVAEAVPFTSARRRRLAEVAAQGVLRRFGIRKGAAAAIGVAGSVAGAAGMLHGSGAKHLEKHARGLGKRGYSVEFKSGLKDIIEGKQNVKVTKVKNVPWSRPQALTEEEKRMRRRRRGY